MPDRIVEAINQTQIDQRANLLYLLQMFARVAEAKERETTAQSEISNEQIAIEPHN